jgi:GntR family transcriptional regulator/MocR family aminotransferase
MAAFRGAVQDCCGDKLEPGPGTGGLQLALWFKDRTRNDVAVAEALRSAGYGPQALSSMHLGDGRPGLLCGIAGLTESLAVPAARAIVAAL